MATYVLVHGAWHGGWCWKRVRQALQEQGHEVFTPTLSGLADRQHLLSPQIGLHTHIADIANLIRWEGLSNVVLCGHSYGGCVVTGVIEAMADQIGAVVYLDAFVLEDGQSLFDTLSAEMRQMQIDLSAQVGDGWKVPPLPAEVMNVNLQDRDWVDRQCTWQPLASFQEKLAVSDRSARFEQSSYVSVTNFEQSPFGPSLAKARERGWHTRVIDCGHDAMLDKPEEVVEAFLGAARVSSG
jgi:pimeloyl-ACP methyl ester carboxylesterase